jgi:hypothetical protein
MYYDNNSNLIDCCTDSTKKDKISAIGYCTNTYGTFFITNNSLYKLNLIINKNNNNFSYSLTEIDIGTVSENITLKCVAYDVLKNIIYLGGTNSYMIYGTYDKINSKLNSISEIKISFDDIYGQNTHTNNYDTDSVIVNAIQLLDKSDISVNANKK